MGKSVDTFFRANVGAVILNSKNEVLAFERTKIKDAWQLPQGGMDDGEEPIHTVMREVREETGLQSDKLEVIKEYPEWLIYELPKEYRHKKVGRGQAQRWFYLRVADDIEIDLSKAEEDEFCNWKWMSMDDLVDVVVEFRKPTYEKLNDYLKSEI